MTDTPAAPEQRPVAPKNSLPTYGECALRVRNSNYLAKRKAEGGFGPEDSDSPQATELHRFIHEYDDADPYRSAWFLHRLEKLLDETRALARRSDSAPTRETAALHACEGLDTSDLAGNEKGWLAGVVKDAARVESSLNRALRARCPGNGDDGEPVDCQSYEASEQGAPCPPGCCVMAEEKDVRAILEAIERDEEAGQAPEDAAPDSGGQASGRTVSEETPAGERCPVAAPGCVVEALRERLEYWRNHGLKSGWANLGPCCDSCRMPANPGNPLQALVGCRDPFQIECECHVPHRRAVRDYVVRELELILTNLPVAAAPKGNK